MSIIKVDDRGRIILPKRLREGVRRVLLIPAGPFMLLIPLRGEPSEIAEGWLPSEMERTELKEIAEDMAKEDAVKRARRRGQL